MSTDDKNAFETAASFEAPLKATSPRTVSCHVALIREEEGDYSAIVLNLPGVGSCGNTSEEAIRNVRDAVKTAVISYEELGMPIPWRTTTVADVPNDTIAAWLDIYV